jgi:hypothetical protein
MGERHRIDWQTTSAEPVRTLAGDENSYELRVRVDSMVTSHWHDAFNAIAYRVASAARGEPLFTGARIWGETIVVSDIKRESRPALQRVLEDIVERTNVHVERERAADEWKRQHADEEEKRRRDEAERITDEFRNPPEA